MFINTISANAFISNVREIQNRRMSDAPSVKQAESERDKLEHTRQANAQGETQALKREDDFQRRQERAYEGFVNRQHREQIRFRSGH